MELEPEPARPSLLAEEELNFDEIVTPPPKTDLDLVGLLKYTNELSGELAERMKSFQTSMQSASQCSQITGSALTSLDVSPQQFLDHVASLQNSATSFEQLQRQATEKGSSLALLTGLVPDEDAHTIFQAGTA